MAAQFKAVKCRIYKNDAMQTEVFTQTIDTVEPDGKQKCKVPFTQGLVGGTSYTFEATHVSTDNLESDPGTVVFTPSGSTIQKPVITSPTINTVLAKGANLNIEVGAFIATPLNSLTHTATEWLVSTSPLFGSNVFSTTSPTNLRSITVPAATFAADTTYYIKVAFHAADGVSSPYSEVTSFKTAAGGVDINTPTLTSPAPGGTLDCKAFALTTSGFSPVNAGATSHTSTLWNVAKDSAFSPQAMVFNEDSAVFRTNVIVSGNLLTPGTVYFVRFKYRSGIYASEWSQTYQIQTQAVGVTFEDKGALPNGVSGIGSMHWLQTAGIASRIGLNVLDGTADASTVYFGCGNTATYAWATNPVSGSAVAVDMISIMSQEHHNRCAFINGEPYFSYVTPGNAFLGTGDILAVDQTCKVFGAGGDDAIVIANGVTDVIVDQNVSTVAVQGASTSYQFQRAGNGLRVFSGTSLICTIFPTGAAPGSRLTFSNGFGYVSFSGTDLTLTGVVVPSTPSSMALGTLDTQPAFSLATLTASISKHLNDASVAFAGNIHRFSKISNNVKVAISEGTPPAGGALYLVKGADSRYVYALAGAAAPYTTFKRCDTQAGNIDASWAVLASLPADCELDSKLIAYGTVLAGYGSKTINGVVYSAYFEYDTVGNTWTVEANTSSDFYFRKDAAVEIVGDFFYVHGGRHASTNTPTNQLWRRSFVLDVWSQLSSGGESISKHVAFSKDMKLHLVGTRHNVVDCSSVGGSCVTVEDPTPIIGTPVIEIPSQGQTFPLETGQIKIQLGAFTVSPAGSDTHKRTRYQIFSSPDVGGVPLVDSDSESYLYTYYPYAGSFVANGTYYVRAMFIGNEEQSAWSNVVSFKTGFSLNKPKLVRVGTITDNNGLAGLISHIQDPNSPLTVQAAPFSTNPPGSGTHVKTEWQLGIGGNFTDSSLADRVVSNGGDSLTKYEVAAAKFNNMYDTTFGLRCMFNDSGDWSEIVKFKTKAAKGWVTVRQYRDDVQLLSAQYLAQYIRRYRCIGLRSKQLPSGDCALFVMGAEGQSNGVWNGREYPMDGSAGRVIKTDVMEYCHFVYCYGYIYRINFKHDGTNGVKVHRLLLTNNLTQTLETWEAVTMPSAGTNNKIYNENISVFVSRNRIFIYAREKALVDGVPIIGMFCIMVEEGQIKYANIAYNAFKIPDGTQTHYFKVDNVISIARDSDSSQTENCVLARIRPATLEPDPGAKGYSVKLEAYRHNVYQLADIHLQNPTVASTVSEPNNGWNPTYDPTNHLIYYNNTNNYDPITIVDPSKLSLGSASAVGTVMNGIGPISNPKGPLDPPIGKVIITHYHEDPVTQRGLYCFGGLVSGLSTNTFYLKKFV